MCLRKEVGWCICVEMFVVVSVLARQLVCMC
jgi:hypothetical protein